MPIRTNVSKTGRTVKQERLYGYGEPRQGQPYVPGSARKNPHPDKGDEPEHSRGPK